MRKFLIAVIMVLSATTLASAADAPPEPAPAQNTAPAFSWTGVYLGAHLGLDWASQQQMLFTDPNGVIGGRKVNTQPKAGFVGGMHAGYNWQFAPSWVTGIEGDISGSSLSTRKSVSPLTFPVNFQANTNLAKEFQADWLASIRARLGFVGWWNTMFYVTGGPAFGGVKYTGIEHNDPPSFFTFFRSKASSDNTRVGWVVGGGAEMPLTDHITIRAEYLFNQFDGTTMNANLLPNPGAFPIAFVYKFSDIDIHIIRLGLTYKF